MYISNYNMHTEMVQKQHARPDICVGARVLHVCRQSRHIGYKTSDLANCSRT